MRFAWGAGLLLVAAAVGTAFAELDDSERKLVQSCLAALASDSGRARAAAEDGLVRIGADAVPEILGAWATLKDDPARAALRQALIRMGAPAADALEVARADWPKADAAAIDDLVRTIRGATKTPDPGVDAEVREILAKFTAVDSYHHDNPDVRRIVSMGRAAVPTLLDVAEAGGVAGPGHRGDDMSRTAAIDALRNLVTEADVPRLVKILRGGTPEIARTFRRVPVPAITDALLEAVESGLVSFDVCEALETRLDDRRVVPTVCKWMSAHATDGDWRVAAAAGLLGRTGSSQAAKALLAALPSARESQTLWRVGQALTNLGRKEGIEALLDVVEGKGSAVGGGSGSRGDVSMRRQAAEAVNDVAGRRIFESRLGGPPGADADVDEATALARSIPEFRKWWKGAKGKIRFDPATKLWSMPQ